jgi:putative tricarboxylic transport membrane protein
MADRVIFVCIVVLAAVYFYATAQIPSLEIGDPLGPKAFPRLLGVALLVTGGILLMEMLGARADKSQETARSATVDRGVIMVIAAVAVWTAVYFVLFEPLGYVIASTIYLIALTLYFNPGRWVMNVTTSALFTIISYLMFSKLLGVTLAKGILPF